MIATEIDVPLRRRRTEAHVEHGALGHAVRGFVHLRCEEVGARVAIVLTDFANALRRLTDRLRTVADLVADERNVLEVVEQFGDAFEQECDEALRDPDERLAHADPKVRGRENLKERDRVRDRLHEHLPERLRNGHERTREKVHRVGEGDFRGREKDVAHLSIRERLNDERHGFAGLLAPAREVHLHELIEQRFEHGRDLIRHADPEPAHLQAGRAELVAHVIEEGGVAGEELRLGADLLCGIAESVRGKQREQLRTAAPENLHRNCGPLRRVLDRVNRAPECAELLGGRLAFQLIEVQAELGDVFSGRVAVQRLRHLAEHRPDVLRRLADRKSVV